ncbi:MAG: hypothetical protein IKS87_01000 [Lachnospiraceae bacterium]|nr:hypothetical protein [Lachnospiraceae bacterium]
MCKVKDEFIVGEYRILGLDEPLPMQPFKFLMIGGRSYTALNVYDAKDAVGIRNEGQSLIGEEVEFSMVE